MHLGDGRPPEFHAPWSAEKEARLHRIIDARFADWRDEARPPE